jgi:hypothetical protein
LDRDGNNVVLSVGFASVGRLVVAIVVVGTGLVPLLLLGPVIAVGGLGDILGGDGQLGCRVGRGDLLGLGDPLSVGYNVTFGVPRGASVGVELIN